MPAHVRTVAPINPLLTNVSVGYTNPAFIAEDVMPVVPVGVEKFTYYRFGRDHWKRYNTRRDVGAKFMRLDYGVSTTTATCVEYGVEHPIDDRIRDEAQRPLDPDVQGTEIVTEALRLDYEKQTSALMTNTANYNASLTSTPTIQWNGTSPTILNDIMAAQEAVRQQIGRYPNTIVIPPQVAQVVAISSELVGYVTNVIGVTALQEGPTTGWMLPRTLFGMQVLIPAGIEVTSNLMQTDVTGDIWSDYVWVGYVNQRPQLMSPSFGYTFRRRSFQISTWRDEAIKSDIIRGTWVQTKDIITVDDDGLAIAAYLYSDVLS